MDSPVLARVAMVVGAVLVLISTFADLLGLGRSPGLGADSWSRRRCSGDAGRGLSVVASGSSGEGISIVTAWRSLGGVGIRRPS